MKDELLPAKVFLLFLFTVFTLSAAGWATHIFHCFQNSEWLILIAGAILFPIGVLHGIWLWF